MTVTRINPNPPVSVTDIDAVNMFVYHESGMSFARFDYVQNGVNYALQWGLNFPHLALFRFNPDGTYSQVWSANVS